ncbi:MAG: helix-turn-helix domain-containing protein [Acholeplasmataceae bacterium]
MLRANELGKKIAELRKEKNLTQSELADKLYVSYQAVSNWERGDSMPDITKLKEIANIFDVSIDALLDNEKSAKVVESLLDDQEIKVKDLEKEVLKEVLHYVKPKQFKEKVKIDDEIDKELLTILLPFLDEETIDENASKIAEEEGLKALIVFAPFMSEETLSKIIRENIDNETGEVDHHLMGLLPFIDSNAVDQIAELIYQKKGARKLAAYAPFMSKDKINSIVQKEIEAKNYKEVIAILPFADFSDLSDIVSFASSKKNKD